MGLPKTNHIFDPNWPWVCACTACSQINSIREFKSSLRKVDETWCSLTDLIRSWNDQLWCFFFFFLHWVFSHQNWFFFRELVSTCFYSAEEVCRQVVSEVVITYRLNECGDAYAVNSQARTCTFLRVARHLLCCIWHNCTKCTTRRTLRCRSLSLNHSSSSIVSMSWKSKQIALYSSESFYRRQQRSSDHTTFSSDCATLFRVRADSRQRLFAHGLLPGFTLDNH